MSTNLIQKNETFVQSDETNLLLQTEQAYVQGSVKVKLVENNIEMQEIAIEEVGDTYITLTNNYPVGTTFKITYNVRVSLSLDIDLLQRIRHLEKVCAQQQEMLEGLSLAVSNRVSKNTFRIWLKAMEKSFGTPILDQNLFGIYASPQVDNDLI